MRKYRHTHVLPLPVGNFDASRRPPFIVKNEEEQALPVTFLHSNNILAFFSSSPSVGNPERTNSKNGRAYKVLPAKRILHANFKI